MVDEDYNGLALDEREGDRLASVLGNTDILFMRNHGVMVCAQNIAEARDDLDHLERVAEVQLNAMRTGRPLLPADPHISKATAKQMPEGASESARLHLKSLKHRFGAKSPDYKSFCLFFQRNRCLPMRFMHGCDEQSSLF